jgi:hypothetical protein
MPLNSDVAVTNLHSVELWNRGDEYIFKMRPFFPKIVEIGRDRPGPNLKITEFWNLNSKISKNKKWKHYVKKLDQILRILVETFF